jgi:hypothetical protein
MKLGEFRKAPQGPYLFEYWESTFTIPSPIGPFGVELRPIAGQSPDEEMVEEARELVAFLVTHGDEIAQKVFEHYQRLADHPEWLEKCGVPESLGVYELERYIRSRALVVTLEEEGPDERYYDEVLFVDPLWDSEHKITLGVRDGRLEFCD